MGLRGKEPRGELFAKLGQAVVPRRNKVAMTAKGWNRLCAE